ncbi:MAG: PA0069 family radical SAM protein [Alphaproteobacteria bacterium]|nr:PA0069 family radical SAM protein [Alphaproteobacteria bacterium]
MTELEDNPANDEARLVRKGRGAASNRAGRFERHATDAIDDGWGNLEEDLPPLRTELRPDTSRSVIAWNDSPDIPFDRSINPYRGCEHGCVYCYARPTHAFLGLSPGQDFESKLFFKPDAAKILEAELAKPSYRCQFIALGTNTDPYQPTEKRLEITRSILHVLAAHDHPLSITTKSALVTRDIDILAPMAAKGLVTVALSVTTLDGALARKLEPRASTPAKRLDAIRQLNEAGVPCGVMVAPCIPGLTDAEMETILEAAHAAGAREAAYIALRLPLEIKDLFEEWMHTHAPGRAKHVLNLVREMRGGGLYQSEFGTRMTGTGPYAALMRRRFELACTRLGLNQKRRALDTTRFHRPPRPGDQLSLL